MSAELQATLAFPPTATHQLRPLHLPSRTGANSPEASVGRGLLDAPEPRASKTHFDLTAKAPDSPRRIINGTVPASRRRSTLSYRNSSIDWPADAVKGIANESGPSSAVHMTMAELQERHKAKLAAKQSRVSATFELELAKQHWEQKVAEERKTMHLRERVRAHEAAVAAAQAEEQLRQQASTGAAQSQYRRSMSQLLILGERDGSAKQDERSDATQRTKEWRQSVRLSKDGASSMDRLRRSRPTSMTLDHQPELSNDPTVRPASAGGFNRDQNHKAAYDKLVSSQVHAEVSERYPSRASANLEKVHRTPKGELTELDRRRISQGALGRPLKGSGSNKTLLDFEHTAIVDQAWNKRSSRTVAGK
ncbi:hypothetical protein CBOM_03192 [Ceraceosorus bombacis]|uniref:Uncharacterized protein n=1 Tax=Ceraceosorus bombacis TaxID=401625 RepID=A0A0P1BLI1_9BASI|nr:hypothetical protein CBOM_03192 [Ceraceosorus bombacis]